MKKNSIITLTTDFETRSGYVGVMKGVILGIAPHVQIVDISHEVSPQDILEAQFLLQLAIPYFPKGTIHVAVVDPGVGTQRRPILVKTPLSVLIGPDNGIFTPWLKKSEIRHLENRSFFMDEISRTFHGRDIFAPVAAHVANGVDIKKLGKIITDPERKNPPVPVLRAGEIRGQVIYIDSFGNLITNISAEDAGKIPNPLIIIGKRKIKGLVGAYAEAPVGKPCALIGSDGLLEIAVVHGNARMILGAKRGMQVKIVSYLA